jgi:uncharacterized membrane protein YqjE
VTSGLVHSAQSLLAGLLALARTRLELFGTELQEELTRLFFTLIGAMAVLLLVALGLGFAALAIIVSLAEESRALAAAAMGVVFLVGAFAAACSMRRLARAKPRTFSATLAELDRDREALAP